ncbi:uncharacterized protein [Amphiura filiformis]|uniref:uncharacterized protein n=1 Tax=Amphiura filiformis TaxID=82378 RepID=UPI003B222153
MCSCPEACFETLFKPTVSQTSFPSRGVATTFFVRGDTEVPAMAFAETVAEAASNQFQALYDDVTWALYGLEYGVPGTNNSNGDIFLDVFPNTTYKLAQILMDDIFGHMQFELFYSLANDLYYEKVLGVVSYAPKSERYWKEYNHYAELWVTSGAYKQKVAIAFTETEEYLPHLQSNQTFDDFIDYVYEEFGFVDLYFTAFPILYEVTYDLLSYYGNETNANADKVRMVTDYMSKNILHVEIFFGDLKVEQITEQPSYELFQFVCDLGGALGLFFGASLLSFIETLDFWFSPGRFGSSKKDKHHR